MSHTSIAFTARATAIQGMSMVPPASARAMGARMMITTITTAAT